MFVNETFFTLYMTVNWHGEFAVNFATFLKVCRDFFTFAPWFSYSPTSNHWLLRKQQCWLIALLTASRRAACYVRVCWAFHPAMHACRTLAATCR